MAVLRCGAAFRRYTGAMSENTESKERLARPLIRLAKLVGIGTSYVGMSHDYPIAIEEGSTMIRVGTHIFGEREY